MYPRLLLPFALILVLSCSTETVNENWIGHYSFPGHEIDFPLHMSIQIKGKEVSGLAIDGNMEEATISGTIENGSYELLLHPVKHGDSKEQDVHYRGKRTGNEIVGEWEHVVGAKGAWVSKLTSLQAEEALKGFDASCKTEQADNKKGCKNDA